MENYWFCDHVLIGQESKGLRPLGAADLFFFFFFQKPALLHLSNGWESLSATLEGRQSSLQSETTASHRRQSWHCHLKGGLENPLPTTPWCYWWDTRTRSICPWSPAESNPELSTPNSHPSPSAAPQSPCHPKVALVPLPPPPSAFHRRYQELKMQFRPMSGLWIYSPLKAYELRN